MSRSAETAPAGSLPGQVTGAASKDTQDRSNASPVSKYRGRYHSAAASSNAGT